MKRILLIIVIIIQVSFVMSDCFSQWVAQTLPVNPEMIYCMKFYNKNTGWMSTGNQNTSYIPKILKTTNGGDNWAIIKDSVRMYSFQVLDSVTVYGRVRSNGYESIYRTFNGGTTWDSVSRMQFWTHNSLYFFDKDTGYVGSSDGNWGYIYKTTDGGLSLTQIYKTTNLSSFGEQMIFFKEKINGEYYGYCIAGDVYMYKTTNSGYNWTQLGGLSNYIHGYNFINKDTGWVSDQNNIKHTKDGGINWLIQYNTLFSNNTPYTPFFCNYNKGWAGTDGNKIYATTNGGQIWGRQITPSYLTTRLCVLDSIYVWAGDGESIISHTTNGGGVILGITKDSTSNNIPKDFTLKQNYPNPFNNSTIIEYSITKKTTIGINIYDVSGRSVYDMTVNNLEPGNYKLSLDFGALFLPSGIYFYKFIVVNEKGIKMFSETKKLMYVK